MIAVVHCGVLRMALEPFKCAINADLGKVLHTMGAVVAENKKAEFYSHRAVTEKIGFVHEAGVMYIESKTGATDALHCLASNWLSKYVSKYGDMKERGMCVKVCHVCITMAEDIGANASYKLANTHAARGDRDINREFILVDYNGNARFAEWSGEGGGAELLGGADWVHSRFYLILEVKTARQTAGAASAEVRVTLPAEPDTAVPADTGTAIPADTGTAVPADTDTAMQVDTGTAVPADTGTAVPADTGTAVPADTGTAMQVDTATAMQVDTGTDIVSVYRHVDNNPQWRIPRSSGLGHISNEALRNVQINVINYGYGRVQIYLEPGMAEKVHCVPAECFAAFGEDINTANVDIATLMEHHKHMKRTFLWIVLNNLWLCGDTRMYMLRLDPDPKRAHDINPALRNPGDMSEEAIAGLRQEQVLINLRLIAECLRYFVGLGNQPKYRIQIYYWITGRTISGKAASPWDLFLDKFVLGWGEKGENMPIRTPVRIVRNSANGGLDGDDDIEEFLTKFELDPVGVLEAQHKVLKEDVERCRCIKSTKPRRPCKVAKTKL